MSNKPSMADLMATYTKPTTLQRGQELVGIISGLTQKDIFVDLGSKAEGVLERKSLPSNQEFKIGDKITAYIIDRENESGQVALTVHKSDFEVQRSRKDPNLARKWQKFLNSIQSNTTLKGEVSEINKGGVVVSIEGVRGFIPTSHLSLEQLKLASSKGGLEGLVGSEATIKVIEADPANNKLVFSSRITTPDQSQLAKFNKGDQVKGKVLLVTPLGISLDIMGVEGLVLSYEAAWERVDNLAEIFKIGDEVEGVVIGVESDRVNVSLRANTQDPFASAALNFVVDDVVKGKVLEITPNGVRVQLEGVEGLIPQDKVESNQYSIGQETNFLVDSIDQKRRVIILAPFITSTKGLIYR